MKYDNLLKTIFYDAMPRLLQALHCAPVVEYLSVEFPTKDKQVADVVARLADGKILHLEFQSANDPRMHWRCYHYFGAIQELWEEAEIVQVVVYFGNGPVRMRNRIDKGRTQHSYDIVDMKEIPAEVFLDSPSDSERVLALLCQSSDPRETIRRVRGSWKHLPEKELLNNIDRLKTLCLLRGRGIMVEEEVERMPFSIEAEMRESIFFKDAYKRAYPEAYRDAYPEAYKVAYPEAYKVAYPEAYKVAYPEAYKVAYPEAVKDATEAITKTAETHAMAKMLTKLLEHRFGPLPEREQHLLASASTDQLEGWALRATDVQRLEDVFTNS